MWWLPYVPQFCLQGKQTGSVAFLYFLVSAEPKNIARRTVRICPQPAGIALEPICFASSRATFGHSGEEREKIEKQEVTHHGDHQLSSGDCQASPGGICTSCLPQDIHRLLICGVGFVFGGPWVP